MSFAAIRRRPEHVGVHALIGDDGARDSLIVATQSGQDPAKASPSMLSVLSPGQLNTLLSDLRLSASRLPVRLPAHDLDSSDPPARPPARPPAWPFAQPP